jgi:hypothetical protein
MHNNERVLMMKHRLQYSIPLVLLIAVLMAACSSGSGTQDAAATVEKYLQAQVNKDLNLMTNLSCAGWEEGARLEYESLAALEVTLEGPGCQTSSQDGQVALVTCSGEMVFNYGTEVLNVPLADKVYRVEFDSGEWLVCGYQ